MYIAQRFVLHIDLQNQPRNSGKRWADLIPVEKYAAVPADGPHTMPESITLTVADELHPQNNRRTTVHVHKDADDKP